LLKFSRYRTRYITVDQTRMANVMAAFHKSLTTGNKMSHRGIVCEDVDWF